MPCQIMQRSNKTTAKLNLCTIHTAASAHVQPRIGFRSYPLIFELGCQAASHVSQLKQSKNTTSKCMESGRLHKNNFVITASKRLVMLLY